MEEKNNSNSNNRSYDSSPRNEENKGFSGNEIKTQDGHFDFLSQKSQRLSTALYMLTNLFEQNDPLRFKLREMAVKLVSDTMCLIHLSIKERDQKIKTTYFLATEILSLCEIGYASGMMSEMNHLILKKEFGLFTETLQSKRVRKDEENTFTIPSNFFSVNEISDNHSGTLLKGGSFEKDIIKNLSTGDKRPLLGYKGHYKRHIDVKDNNVLYKDIQRTAPAVDRREMILKAFRDRKEGSLTIKDIGEVIKDCSEKTIQRQLIDMVKNGVLEKHGERRWSSYSIKK
ncbi:MAG: hypothetical protein PHS53_02305 [Candidatus Pacebacteria bacterium]|nr:hypothetical protein [Candidatus Paceibacterota bacterium]MDD5356958.1 hypothetical protein [Candidatus Paceibacterota bacterium]